WVAHSCPAWRQGRITAKASHRAPGVCQRRAQGVPRVLGTVQGGSPGDRLLAQLSVAPSTRVAGPWRLDPHPHDCGLTPDGLLAYCVARGGEAMAPWDLKDKAAICGVGHSPYGRRLDRSPIDLAGEALRQALDDAGLDRDALDGLIVSFVTPIGVEWDRLA